MAFGYGYPYQSPMYQPPNPAPYQQQISSMPPQYQQQLQQSPIQQPAQAQIQQQPNVICRPVASEEEAKAVPTDFSGATLVLTDTAHGRIYTKALNYMDGSALFNIYQLVQQPAAETQQAPAVEYAPMSVVESLKEEIQRLREEVEESRTTPVKRASTKGGASE